MGIMVYSLLWEMQDLDYQQYRGSFLNEGPLFLGTF